MPGLQLRQRAVRRGVELVETERRFELVRGEVDLIGEGVEESERHVRRGKIRRDGERAQRGVAGRFEIFRVALLRELQEVGAAQVRERGREPRVLRDNLLEQWNRRFERLRPVVMRQQLVRAPVVLLQTGDWRRRARR